MQKLIPFESVKNNKVNSSENHDEGHCNNERPARRAAVEGQQLRKIRDLYYWLLVKVWEDVESTWFLSKQSSYKATFYIYFFNTNLVASPVICKFSRVA